VTPATASGPAIGSAFGAAGALQALAAVMLVLGLVAGLAWLVRRGTLRLPGSARRQAMAIESATPLGERRSLLIVSVEGRRLLLGITPTQVSLVTELGATPPDFSATLQSRLQTPGQAS
jgi:flagellar protein FliO/FliZ